jgi:pyruvate/2-oxoglutarate dehydrogenase complex dihydrolipoamide dehydrogenase (E3) component
MSGTDRYDVVIIGAGQAGPSLAHGLANAGRRVAMAERKDLGGSCVNFGCTPTKAAIASARVAHDARRAAEFGVRVTGVEVDFPAVLRRAREVALGSRRGLERGFEGSDNPKLLRGHARIEGRDGDRFRVRLGDGAVSAAQIVIDTGTRTAVPRIDGLDTVDFIHAGNWLDTPELPRHVAMVGGGYIALEMSQFYRRMGSRVTVIERSARIAGREDDDVAAALTEVLRAEGVEFRFAAGLGQVDRRPTGVRVHLEQSGRAETIDASHLFVATGRMPNTDDLGLETVGVRRSDHGFIETDRRLATSVGGIWAAGDVRGGPMFTHTAWDDYRVLMSQLAGDGSRTTERIVPYAVFTDPELGRVGVTEAEAKRGGRDVKVARFDMARNSKARELGDPGGFIKVIAERATGQLVGAAVLAVGGAELVHLYVEVMNAGAPYTVIRDAVQIHPTLAEAVQSAVAALDGSA